MKRFITFEYSDGSKYTQEWSEILDGPWKHDPTCYEVVYKLNVKNPLYEEYD